MRDDPEFIKAAVKYNEWTIKHVSPRLLAASNFLTEMIYEHPGLINKIPENMQIDIELYELARRRREDLNLIEPRKPDSYNIEDDDLTLQ